jgi:large subunit ribosomal protein L18
VVRPSNKHLAAQIVQATPEGDRILASAHSSELAEFGWRAPCGNMPAAYLTGLLAGRRAKTSGVSEAILDVGLHAASSGTRIFAAAKGALDAGLSIPHGKEALPTMERIQGKHIVDYSKALSSTPEVHRKAFSLYLKGKLNPEEIPDHFASVETKIKTGTGEVAK